MKSIVLILLVFWAHVSFGQKMYLDSMYSKVNVTTHQFKTKDGAKLELDYYRAEGANGKLPLVVYVHGGGFNSGTRNNGGIQYFAKRLAKRGYAVASVSYRLTLEGKEEECELEADEFKEAIENASYDVMMGVKYIVENNTLFLIEEEKVILAGSSAGAEAVLNIAYGFDYASLIANFKFAGVIGMSGSITNLSNITAENAIPTQMFHGTEDEIVPYNKASHHYCRRMESGYLIMYGSGSIAGQLKTLGKPYYLYAINGGTHEWAGIPTKRCFTEIVDFLYNDVMYPKLLRQTERTVTELK